MSRSFGRHRRHRGASTGKNKLFDAVLSIRAIDHGFETLPASMKNSCDVLFKGLHRLFGFAHFISTQFFWITGRAVRDLLA